MAVRATDNNLLTFDEYGTGRLIELDHATGTTVQTFTLGAPQLTYALLARYLSATLVYGQTVFGGAIGLLGGDGNTTYTWITKAVIEDIDDLGAVGLLVDQQLRILFVQQIAPTAVEGDQFKVRRWDIFGTVQTFTFTLPAEPFGVGDPALLPMGRWQGDVGFWGCALSPDGQTVYLLTRQYLYACSLAASTMTRLVDFGGAELMANGGLACRPSDGRLYAGVVQLEPSGDEWTQAYSVNVYDAAGALVDTKLINRSAVLSAPSGTGSFGPSMDIGTSDGELWFYFTNMNDDPSFEDAADRLQVNVFHGATPTPPVLMQYRATHQPGLATKFNTDATVAWAKFYANPVP